MPAEDGEQDRSEHVTRYQKPTKGGGRDKVQRQNAAVAYG